MFKLVLRLRDRMQTCFLKRVMSGAIYLTCWELHLHLSYLPGFPVATLNRTVKD
uniref:Uncharacterized protein n=1 Tax=Anguilla anguilla TaxID=7936 RepID=A0A0E9R3P1_ANGAN